MPRKRRSSTLASASSAPGEAPVKATAPRTATPAKRRRETQQRTAAANHPGALKLLEDTRGRRTSEQKAADDLQAQCNKDKALTAEQHKHNEKARSVVNLIDAACQSSTMYKQDHTPPMCMFLFILVTLYVSID